MKGMESTQVERNSQVNDKLQVLSQYIDETHCLVDSLSARIQGVLLSPVPEPCEEMKEPASNLVPLAEELRILGARANHTKEQLANMISRIEL